MTHTTRFQSLKITNWRQFRSVDIEFHPTLTILTGANGAGKSSLLGILGQQFGWNKNFLALPRKEKGSSAYRYVTGFGEDEPENDEEVLPPRIGQTVQVGVLTYSNGLQALIKVPAEGSISYAAQIEGSSAVDGVFVSPVRSARQYQRVPNIPTEPMLPKIAYQQWLQLTMQNYLGSYTPESAYMKMKQALISMAMFGPGNINSSPLPEVSEAFDGFVAVLKRVLPRPIGFRRLSVRTPDIVVETDSGEWLIDEASGGVAALIELAWQIFLFSAEKPSFVVLIDEPENHLHPSMQRRIIPNLIEAFPNVQFVIATHSPFVVSSVKDSSVYVLHYKLKPSALNIDDDARSPVGGYGPSTPEGDFFQAGVSRNVVSTKLDLVTKAGTASEVLRDVLGVPITTPEWVVSEINQIIARYRNLPFSTDTMNIMRAELNHLGMGDRFPEALAGVADDK